MDKTSTILKLCFITTLMIFLTACSSADTSAIPTAGMDVDAIRTEAVRRVLTQWAQTTPTTTARSTSTPPSATPTPSPSPMPLPPFPMDGYVMVFKKDGGLYFQDGNNAPVKLAHVRDESPEVEISDDHQKMVVTSLGGTRSFDSNGSEGQRIPLGRSDEDLWGTRAENMEFVPSTHQLLFRKYVCQTKDTTCVSSIFLTDADTGETQKLADLGYSGDKISFSNSFYHKNFELAPNGNLVAVATTDHVYILDMRGKVVRDNILPYKPNTPQLLFAAIAWLPDSSGLIVALPNTLFDSVAYDYVPAHTIWRYTISSNVAVQVPFDPPPMFGTFRVSPDAKWIVYGGIPYNPQVYLGNLADGTTQNVGDSPQTYFHWSPDSRHFFVTSAGSVLGGIDMPAIMPFSPICHPTGRDWWIDSTHFLCSNRDRRYAVAELGEGAVIKLYGLELEDGKDIVFLIEPK